MIFPKGTYLDQRETRIDFETRAPSASDIEKLAELMNDAYQGTIDYDGETIQQALKEADSFFTRKDAVPMLSCSLLATSGGRIVSACLASKWEKRPEPLIAYVMTLSELKGKGLATALMGQVLKKIHGAGYGGARAIVTEGNRPSERIMDALRFVRVT